MFGIRGISCHELGSAHLDTRQGSSRKLIGVSDQQEQALVQRNTVSPSSPGM